MTTVEIYHRAWNYTLDMWAREHSKAEVEQEIEGYIDILTAERLDRLEAELTQLSKLINMEKENGNA